MARPVKKFLVLISQTSTDYYEVPVEAINKWEAGKKVLKGCGDGTIHIEDYYKKNCGEYGDLVEEGVEEDGEPHEGDIGPMNAEPGREAP